MHSSRIYLLIISIQICISCFKVGATESLKFYISTNGNDLNDGTINQPFASFEAAQNAVREAKKQDINRSIEVIVRKGEYFLQQTIEFKPEDSGTKDAPITWRAAENESVILSGGRQIVGKWKKDADGKTWFVNLPTTKGWKRDISKPEIYQQKPVGAWNFRQLYVNEKSAIRARFPNRNEQNPFLYSLDGNKEYVKLSAGQVKASWGAETDAQINIVPQWHFFNQWNDVAKVDVNESTITIGPLERNALMDKGSWFWIEGVKSELDQPGEWYLDTKIGRLYYMSQPGENPNRMSMIAPYLNRIFYLKGDVEKGTHVEFVSFKGFEFRHSTYTLGQIEARVHTDGAVMFENTENCSIENCTFENIGGYALWLHLDSKNNSFCYNTVLNSGGGGVLLTGSRLSYMDDSKIYTPGEAADKVAPYLTEISHNTVKHCGKIRYYGGGVHIDSRPAAMAMLPGNHIAHNHFQDLSRNGVFTFRNQGGNVVEYNEIHDCMQTTIDGAAIHFASMNRFNAPNYILNNYLYDMWGYKQNAEGKPERMLANGIFLDWATSNTTVKNNVIYNSGEKEIKNIMGNWNLEIDSNQLSKTRIEPLFTNELGPKGSALNFKNVENLRTKGRVILSTDKELVQYSGEWTKTSETGMWGLFVANYFHAAPEKSAHCTYQLPVDESGVYKVCLFYFPNDKNASNAKIVVKHAKGEDTVNWNFKKGDKYGFAVVVGEYYLDKDKSSTLTITNTDANGFIVADGVGFIKQK